MSFPFEVDHLLAHLRASYVVLADNDKYAARIIKQIDVEGETYRKIPTLEIPDSPPITFHVARHVQKSVYREKPHNRDNRVYHRRHKNQKNHLKNHLKDEREHSEKLKDPIDIEESEGVLSDQDEPGHVPSVISKDYEFSRDVDYEDDVDTKNVLEQEDVVGHKPELNYSKTIRGSKKSNKKSKSPGISRFFQSKGKEEIDPISDSDSDGSIITSVVRPSLEQNLELIEEENNAEVTDDGDITETEEKRRSRVKGKKRPNDNSDVISIDSDFGVPVDSNGQVVRNYVANNELISDKVNEEGFDGVNEGGSDEGDGSERGDSVEDEGDIYQSDEFDDVDSTDSAFTDIETDSILDSSILLNSYADSTFSYGNTNTNNSFKIDKKTRRLKKRGGSFDQQPSLTKYNHFRQVPSQVSLYPMNKPPTRKQLSFHKFDINSHPQDVTSNLSSLIKSRFKNIHTNPLTYYSFVDSAILSSDTRISISIYIPPSNTPTIKQLKVDPKLAIVDCIGYTLLTLSKMAGFENMLNDMSFMNPNCWRFELVDEDGENYGSFGILDRSRDLASYNSPKEIALCKITSETEISKNETQTPLPVEVKSNLAAYSRRITSEDKEKAHELVNLRIMTNNKPNDAFEFEVSSNWTVGQVLKEFCVKQGLPLKYTFKRVIPTTSLLLNETKEVSLDDKVQDLGGNVLMLVPSTDILRQFQEKTSSFSNITPSESTFTNITPDKKQLEDKFEQLSLRKPLSAIPEARLKTSKPTNFSSNQIDSNKYLNDIMTGRNPSLPTNLNTIYFKWKVFRKKTTILNKIEKFLVLDGDYIHLTPTDDIVFKQTPGDNPFTNSSEHSNTNNHHHHHHIHHYNYTNYYKESVMKTSSFHITQIVKLKQYKNSKNPNHFKIVIQKNQDNSKESIKKKYDLEAMSVQECQEIIDKLKWVLQIYSMM